MSTLRESRTIYKHFSFFFSEDLAPRLRLQKAAKFPAFTVVVVFYFKDHCSVSM